MRRLALLLVAAVALGVTGCAHGSKYNQAAPTHSESVALPAPSPYTPRMVQRAFAEVGLPVAHDRLIEAMTRRSGDSSTAAFFTNATGDVQVVVLRGSETSEATILVRGENPVTKWSGNVAVTYPKGSPKTLLVLLALTKLGSDSMSNSRYSQGTDSTGAAYCVVYDHNGAGGSVRAGSCPKP